MSYAAPVRDIMFALGEVIGFAKLQETTKYCDCDPETIAAILEAGELRTVPCTIASCESCPDSSGGETILHACQDVATVPTTDYAEDNARAVFSDESGFTILAQCLASEQTPLSRAWRTCLCNEKVPKWHRTFSVRPLFRCRILTIDI